MTKEEVIAILDDIAVLLELSGENPFKARAYQTAARNLERIDTDFDTLVCEGRIFEVAGIGEAIGKKITELATTGKLDYYENLRAQIPVGHLEMLRVVGLGTKKIHILHRELGIANIGELEYCCLENRLVGLKGFGKKTQEKILKGIEQLKHYQDRRLYEEAVDEAEALYNFLGGLREVSAASIAGSLRRGNETVKDIDLLASSDEPAKLAEAFTRHPKVENIVSMGETKVSVRLKSGMNCDLRIVSETEYPYALHHFTGSKEHNVAMRGRAKDLGLKMNEYGLFRGNQNIACRTEEEIFAALGLSYIPPELRENMGEIEAAESGELPILVEENDIRGIFHNHTNASDGHDSLENMIAAAREMGLQYIGVSDHSKSVQYAGGLKEHEIDEQHKLIDELNAKYAPFHVFKGIEADILADGSLDYDDETLAKFDFVIAAVHSGFNMPAEEMTARIVKALRNRHTTMLAHPTGRILLSREPYALNMIEVIDAAAQYGKALEFNANPHRLDLDWRYCIIAKRRGVKISINPDAHRISNLRFIKIGVKIARKGWLEKSDCFNAMDLQQVTDYLKLAKAAPAS